MVCLGNICRSPLADGLLRDKVLQNKLAVNVDSAGTANYHTGGAPDLRMTQTAQNNGIDISGLRARQFEVSDFDKFDWIYVMDQSNFTNVTGMARHEMDAKKVKLILSELEGSSDLEVPDPYYGEQDGFDRVYEMLDQATEQILIKLLND